jgi:hypothetical protein
MHKTIITPRSFCCLALLCCLALPAAADDVQLQENHPDRHVVVKGDTLWGISGKFLKDPWQWPKVWKMNRDQIKNPHLIYPGDVIALDMSSGSPQLRLLRETVTLEPGIREEALEKAAVPTISPYIIAPFLSQPLVIENGVLNDAPIIIGGQENRVVLSPGVKIYVDKIDEDKGTFWQVYRSGKELVDPITKEVLGTEAIYLGDAKVTNYGEPASAEIVRAKEEIFKGDKLVAATEESTASFIPRAPEEQIAGQILSIYSGVAEAGANAIVTLNRGSSDGLEEGHVLAIYREGKIIRNSIPTKGEQPYHWEKTKNPPYRWGKPSNNNSSASDKKPEGPVVELDPTLIKLPSERVGLLMIFRIFDRVSYGLIMQASEPVNVLDLVQTP